MRRVVVAGGGIAGLATALAAAGAGLEVVVLERDSAPPPGQVGAAGVRWRHPGVPQRSHGHLLTSLGVSVLREHAPGLLGALFEAGAVRLDLTSAMPPEPAGISTVDGELVALGCRRTTLDVVLHRYAAPRVPIRYGRRVHSLCVRDGRVTGVRTERGERLSADLVVDATGARSRSLLATSGIEPGRAEWTPSGTRVFSRFYRGSGRFGPLNRGNAAGVLTDELAGVLHPADDDTFSVTLGAPLGEEPPELRSPEGFDRVARTVPFVRDWLADEHRPISGVSVTNSPGSVLRLRSPVAGLVAVGDTACITNPLYGRGMSLALAHGFRLGALLRERGADPDLGTALAEQAAKLYTPWFRQSADEDIDRLARLRCARDHRPAPPATAALPLITLASAAARDSVVWRETARMLMSLRSPAELAADAAFTARVASVAASQAGARL